ncbi:MAG: spore coat protein [bacterium]|nr:spore coat protein [bacterium]
MKSNKVCNMKVEVPTGIEMNDKDYLTTVLELEKNLSNNYSWALNEASNDYLYEDYFGMFEDTKDMSREIFNLLFQKGWYSLEKAEEDKIDEKIQCLQNQLLELDQNH